MNIVNIIIEQSDGTLREVVCDSYPKAAQEVLRNVKHHCFTEGRVLLVYVVESEKPEYAKYLTRKGITQFKECNFRYQCLDAPICELHVFRGCRYKKRYEKFCNELYAFFK